MTRPLPFLSLLVLLSTAAVNVGQSAFASTCVSGQLANSAFDIVAEVRVLSVDESGTAATVALTKQIKGHVPLKVFGIYSYRPTPSPNVDPPLIAPSNTLFMQAGTGLRVRGQWKTYLPPIDQIPARFEVDLCSTEVIIPPGPFVTTIDSSSYRVNAGNDALVHSTTRLAKGTARRPVLRLDLGNAPKGVALLTTTTTGDTIDFLLSTAPTTEPGAYRLKLVATGSEMTRTIPFVLRVTAQRPGFGLSVQLSSTTVAAGAATTQASSFNVSLETSGGFADPVGFAVSGLPKDATVLITQTTAGATIQIATKSTTPPGRYPLFITARSGARTSTLPATVEVLVGLAA